MRSYRTFLHRLVRLPRSPRRGTPTGSLGQESCVTHTRMRCRTIFCTRPVFRWAAHQQVRSAFGGKNERNIRMHIFWGCLTVAIGLALFVGGHLKSEFVLYRLLVARSKLLWGRHVHRFHQVAGLMVICFGILLALGIVPMT